MVVKGEIIKRSDVVKMTIGIGIGGTLIVRTEGYQH